MVGPGTTQGMDQGLKRRFQALEYQERLEELEMKRVARMRLVAQERYGEIDLVARCATVYESLSRIEPGARMRLEGALMGMFGPVVECVEVVKADPGLGEAGCVGLGVGCVGLGEAEVGPEVGPEVGLGAVVEVSDGDGDDLSATLSISSVASDLGLDPTRGDLKAYGIAMKRAYVLEHRQPPKKHDQVCGGAVRAVNTYTASDRPLMERVLKEHVLREKRR